VISLQGVNEKEAPSAGGRTVIRSFINEWLHYDRRFLSFLNCSTYSDTLMPTGRAGFLALVAKSGETDLRLQVCVALNMVLRARELGVGVMRGVPVSHGEFLL